MLCRFNFSHLRLDEIIDYGSAPSGKLRIEVLVLADFQGFLLELWPRLSTNLGGWCAKEVHHPGRDHSCGLGRELQELLLLMEQILHQLRLVIYPIIYRGFIHPRLFGISSINRRTYRYMACNTNFELLAFSKFCFWKASNKLAIHCNPWTRYTPNSPRIPDCAFVSWFWISEKDLQLTTSTNLSVRFQSFSMWPHFQSAGWCEEHRPQWPGAIEKDYGAGQVCRGHLKAPIKSMGRLLMEKRPGHRRVFMARWRHQASKKRGARARVWPMFPHSTNSK